MAKFKTGDRVQYHGTEIIKTPRYEGKTGVVTNGDACNVRWDDGEDAKFLLVGNLRLLPASPVRTETVTKRHVRPGVYGRLWVEDDMTGYVSIALTSIDGGGRVGEEFRRSLSASELRELARVALELAEYLDGLD